MINPDTLEQLNNLCELYKHRWEKKWITQFFPAQSLKRNCSSYQNELQTQEKVSLLEKIRFFGDNKKDTFQ